MALRRIASKTGDKLLDTKTHKFKGSVGLGKEKALPKASSVPNISKTSKIKDEVSETNSSGQVLTPGGRMRYKDPLSITHSELSLEAHGWDPATLKAGSNQIVEWQCQSCQTVWSVSPRSRVVGRGGKYCPSCPRVKKGSVPLSERFPLAISEADGWDPSKYSYGSGEVKPWKCSVCQHRWSVAINSRTSYNTGCPKCANKNTQDITVTNPELAVEADGWNPSQYTAGSNAVLNWKCGVCENTWEASIHNRLLYSTRWGCVKCNQYAGQYMKVFGQSVRIVSPLDSIATKYPELVREMVDPAYAQSLGAASRVEVEWKCSVCETKWVASLKNRTLHDTGCPNCAESGFNPEAEAYLYFVEGERDGVNIVQYGITNNLKKRLSYHKRNGFAPKPDAIFLRCGRGAEAFALESQIKRNLVSLSVPSIKTDDAVQDSFGGYTESYRKELLPAGSLKELLEKLSITVPIMEDGGDGAIVWSRMDSTSIDEGIRAINIE